MYVGLLTEDESWVTEVAGNAERKNKIQPVTYPAGLVCLVAGSCAQKVKIPVNWI